MLGRDSCRKICCFAPQTSIASGGNRIGHVGTSLPLSLVVKVNVAPLTFEVSVSGKVMLSGKVR